MQELVDRVDSHDRIIDTPITKQYAHNNKLIHRVAVIYLFDSRERLVLQVHKKSGGRLDHSVGGHVHAGESYLAAALREAKEELGITNVKLVEILSSHLSLENKYSHMYTVYKATIDSLDFKPNEEVSKVKSVTLPELLMSIDNQPSMYTSGLLETIRFVKKFL